MDYNQIQKMQHPHASWRWTVTNTKTAHKTKQMTVFSVAAVKSLGV